MNKKRDIQRLFDQEEPATAAEAALTQFEVGIDPTMARHLFTVLQALAETDQSIWGLFQEMLGGDTPDKVQRRMAHNDAYALEIGRRAVGLMQLHTPDDYMRRDS